MYLVKAAACWVLLMLALADLRERRLSNFFVALFAACFFLQAAPGLGSPDSARAALQAHALVGAGSFALAALLFRLGWLGGGDAKLAAAVFLWAGPLHAAKVLFIVSLSGLIVGLVVIACGIFLRRHARFDARLAWLSPSRGVPYGVALALGGAAAVWLPPATGPVGQSSVSIHQSACVPQAPRLT